MKCLANRYPNPFSWRGNTPRWRGFHRIVIYKKKKEKGITARDHSQIREKKGAGL